MATEKIVGQESWVVETPAVKAAVTVQGAMIAPMEYRLPDGGTASPLYVSPWQEEDTGPIDPPVLEPLRGDFFCLPFGAENKVGEEDHLPHGEAASRRWDLISLNRESSHTALTLGMNYDACPGRVTRELQVGNTDHTVISRTTMEGFSGRYPLGYHATLQGGDQEGVWKIYTDKFDLGITCPDYTAPTADGEYYALAPDARFTSLEEVPTRWKDPPATDCSIFPARRGFVDIFALYRKRSPTAPLAQRLSWTVAVNRPGKYLWYSIKDASVLPATVFWWENGGRHQPPWSGRNSCLGLEETCTFFAAGRTASVAENSISRAGIATAISLDPKNPTTVWSLQGVLPLSDTEVAITGMSLDEQGHPVFLDASGRKLPVPVSVAGIV